MFTNTSSFTVERIAYLSPFWYLNLNWTLGPVVSMAEVSSWVRPSDVSSFTWGCIGVWLFAAGRDVVCANRAGEIKAKIIG